MAERRPAVPASGGEPRPEGEPRPVREDPEALTADERERIERFAEEIVRRRLGAAAIFFLEGLRPLNFVLSQGMVFFSPLVHLLMKGEAFDRAQELLEKRAALPAIVERIEQLEEERRERP